MATDFIYLASASARRRELLEQIGVPFRVLASTASEEPKALETAEAYVARVAGAKADTVWEQIRETEPAPVLAADTAVVVGAEVLGKPASEAAALDMLARLSGRSHRVLTAVSLRWHALEARKLVASEVRFRTTTEAERVAYCRTREPFDKAGAYAIQGFGAVFVEHLAGSFSAVMGLPLAETAALLEQFGMPAWLKAGTRGR
jgi:septum formation protein